jgi:hypothetical protein
LGEDHFAPKGQEDNIALAFKDGLVGAEVVLDGTVWAIVREIGITKRNVAVPGGDLDALAGGAGADTGVENFMEAVGNAVLSPDIASLMPGEHAGKAWLIALAWLTRDQECHFDDVLDWRRAISDSGSPARGLSATTTLDAMRALLGAIDPKEHQLSDEIGQLDQKRTEMKREVGHHGWQAARKRAQLAKALSLQEAELPYGELAIKVFQDSARKRLAAVAIADPSVDVSNIEGLRSEWDETRSRAEALANELAQIDARIVEIEAGLRRMRGETSNLSYSVLSPICPMCEVPVDRVLAEGCKLSHKVPNLEEIKQRRDTAREELDKENCRLEDFRQKRPDIAAAHAAARSRADELRGHLRAAEQARDTRAEAWYSARRLLDDADRLYGLLSAQLKADDEVGHLDARIEKKRAEVAAYRDGRAHIFGRLGELFNALVQAVVGPRAIGQVALDGNGLHLTVDLGGDRSSPAIGSLKVLAFDLAAMCMSMEGNTHIPAFLIHDSPREADLGLSAYHKLFEVVRSLENVGDQPLFQYIVTTTTRPPDELQKKPWLVLTLGGEPAEERLLKCDLR